MDLIFLLALLTILANITLVIVLAVYFLKKTLWKNIEKLIVKNSIKYAFIVALTATLGSLYLSEVRGFAPCRLCWFQRIFMYPQAVILGVALIKKYKDALNYTFPLSLIGGIIAIYHYYLQVFPNAYAPCATVGFSISCNERFFTYFGYITIPWMSFTAFLLIALISFVSLKIFKD